MTSAILIAKRNMTAQLIREVKAKRSKYKNVRVKVGPRTFDSKAEARRGHQLEILQKAGLIKDLKYQVRFKFLINGTDCGSYVADFTYFDEFGQYIVEDVKGVSTPIFKLKERLMRACHGITVKVTK